MIRVMNQSAENFSREQLGNSINKRCFYVEKMIQQNNLNRVVLYGLVTQFSFEINSLIFSTHKFISSIVFVRPIEKRTDE